MNRRAKLEVEIETMLINFAFGTETGISSRVMADDIVKMVEDTLSGERDPKDSTPWEAFAVKPPGDRDDKPD